MAQQNVVAEQVTETKPAPRGDAEAGREQHLADAAAQKLLNEADDSIFLLEMFHRDGRHTGGTGWLGPDGRLVTNYHVVKETLNKGGQIFATDHTGKRYQVGTNSAVDPVTDLALLDFAGDRPNAPQLPLSTDVPKPNDVVSTLGHPHGGPLTQLRGPVTGTTTNADRFKVRAAVDALLANAHEYPAEKQAQIKEFFSLPMFNAKVPAERGNSGGPTFDRDGKVVGVVASEVLQKRETLMVPTEHIISLSQGAAPHRQFALTGHYENSIQTDLREFRQGAYNPLYSLVPEFAVGTGTALTLAGIRPRVGIATAATGLLMRGVADGMRYSDATSSSERLKYGLSLASDVTAGAGLTSIALSSAGTMLRRFGIAGLALGLSTRLAWETIPTNYVVDGAKRLDGKSERMFDLQSSAELALEQMRKSK